MHKDEITRQKNKFAAKLGKLHGGIVDDDEAKAEGSTNPTPPTTGNKKRPTDNDTPKSKKAKKPKKVRVTRSPRRSTVLCRSAGSLHAHTVFCSCAGHPASASGGRR